jgi:hypothetical protein
MIGEERTRRPRQTCREEYLLIVVRTTDPTHGVSEQLPRWPQHSYALSHNHSQGSGTKVKQARTHCGNEIFEYTLTLYHWINLFMHQSFYASSSVWSPRRRPAGLPSGPQMLSEPCEVGKLECTHTTSQ